MVIDMGAMVGGYTADLTRTICLGAPATRCTSTDTIRC